MRFDMAGNVKLQYVEMRLVSRDYLVLKWFRISLRLSMECDYIEEFENIGVYDYDLILFLWVYLYLFIGR